METQTYIGVFDSGVGGISVLRELVSQMPGEHFLYFGDSANAPYGIKSTQEVRALSLQAAAHLASRRLKALVVACNTATAAAIQTLRQQYPNLLVVGIEPAVKPAAEQFPGGRVGVMATEVTLREKKLNALLSCYPETEFVPIPAPGVVELVEQGKADSPEMDALLQTILGTYKGHLDGLVLGCTHYPFVKKAIRRILGDIPLFDGGEGTARHTRALLAEHGLLSSGPGSVEIENSLGCDRILALSHTLLDGRQEVSNG